MYSIRPAAAAAAATFRHSPAVCADSGGGGRTAVGGLAQPRSAAATTAKSLRAGDPTDDRKVFIQPDYGDALHSIDLATFATPTQPTETTVIVAAMAFLPSFNTSFEAGFPTPPHQSPNYSLNYNFMYSPSFIQSSSSSPASSSDFEQDHYGGDCSSSSNTSSYNVYPLSPSPPATVVFPPSPISEDESAANAAGEGQLDFLLSELYSSVPTPVQTSPAAASTTFQTAPTTTTSPSPRRRHQCIKCPKSFASPSQLEEHVNIRHSDARNHECSKCSKVFKTKSNLNQHLRTHLGNRFRCSICSQSRSFTESGYRYHLLTKHSEDAVRRRFPCPLCPSGTRSFAQNKLLQKHLSSFHSDERKHSCPHCPQAFKRRDHLARHVGDSHSVVEALFECSAAEDCGARFQSPRRLRQHEILHKSAAGAAVLSRCADCQKAFLKSENLAEHVRAVHSLAGQRQVSEAVQREVNLDDVASVMMLMSKRTTTTTTTSFGGSEGSSSGGEDDDLEDFLLFEGIDVNQMAVDLLV